METSEFETPEPQERDIAFAVHKLTYADGQAYGYVISDDEQQLRYVGKRTGLHLPSQTRLIEFFDVQDQVIGRLQPPDTAPWLRAKYYEIFVGEEMEEPYAVIREYWRLVDILLLHLPRYELRVGEHRYVVRGSRYGSNLYRITLPDEEEEKEEEETTEPELEPEEIIESIFEPKDSDEAEAEAEDEPQVEDWDEFEVSELELPEDEAEQDEDSPSEVLVGSIQRSAAGPSYVVEVEPGPLRETPLVMASLVALIDMEQHD